MSSQNVSVEGYLNDHNVQTNQYQKLGIPDVVVVIVYFILVIGVGLMVRIPFIS